MKKIIAGALSLTLALGCLAMPAEVGDVFRSATVIEASAASADTYGDFTYKTLSDGTISISGYSGSGGAVTIPSRINGVSVTTISSYAFKGNTAITEVVIPDTIVTIGDDAFCNCSNLSSVTLGNNVATISGYAFAGCSKLSSVTFPSSLTAIKASAFFNCSGLKSLSFPASLTTIGNSAFESCTGLTSVSIPATVTSLGSMVFYNCSGLKSITVSNANEFYTSSSGVLFNKAKTKLLQYPIGNTQTSYTVPAGVTMIGDSAFESCTYLTDVYLSDDLTTIGEYAFYANTALSSITIEENVKKIGYAAFYDCTSLKNVYYAGDQTQWKAINIDDDNSNLTRATINYNYNQEHVHSYTSKVTTAATCNDDGVRTYTCSCGDSYTEVIKAPGHNYAASVIAPTYAAQGYTLHKCTACGYSYKDTFTDQKTVPAASISSSYTSTGTSFTFKWGKISDATGYYIYKYDGINKKWVKVKTITGASNTSATVSGYTPGSVLKFKVNAYVVENGITYYGSAATSIYAAALAKAKISTNYTSTGTSNTLNWDKVQGATGYILYKFDGINKKWVKVKTITGASTTSTTVTGITPGSVIKYKVNAYLTKGTKTYYGKTSSFLYAASIAPCSFNSSYTATTTSASVSWGKVPGATGYKIYKYDSANKKWVLAKTITSASTTSATVTGLTSGTATKLKVNAYLTKGTTTYLGKAGTMLTVTTK